LFKYKKILFIFLLGSVILILHRCQVSDAEDSSAYRVSSDIWNPKMEWDTANFIYPKPENNNCVNCHNGIEPIRDHQSGMMQEIFQVALKIGTKDNECVVCHGGNPLAKDAIGAHLGSFEALKAIGGPSNFYPDPASVWINDKTCGMCHAEQVSTQFTSLMFTEAGKIQGTTWGFGGLQGYEHNVANLAVEELAVHERLGSETYKAYMADLKKAEPQVFPGKMKALPAAPTMEEVSFNPEKAVYTYLRAECQRCHIGVKGHNAEGDYRGTGCGSCHIPYSTKGYYEGGDKSIDVNKQGKLLVHSIQSTRDAKVKVHGKEYSGVPTKTCTACHNRGRRIGVSYEGLMETSYQSPFMSNGSGQSKLHKKNYLHLQPDLHLDKGMLCQDCHTSGDMHSLGDLSGAIQGAVEIECEDCHGTPKLYPWELPIGYGDEIVGEAPRIGKARGVSDTVAKYLKKGWVGERKDGYLLSSRGNAMPHLVKNGEEVILYSSSGKDLNLKPLKKLVAENALSQEAKVAMLGVSNHIDKMECYACHATWAPQCYGCHISIDYTKAELSPDWVALANDVDEHGQTPDAVSEGDYSKIREYLIRGEVTEQRSYLRWEDPPLVINGDHRVSPAIPGCQTTVTVKDANGNVKLLNHIFKIAHVEGAGAEGQLAIDMAPLHPHTTQKKARSCESCHTNPKAMGLGINGGLLYKDPSKDIVMDLTDIDGKTMAKNIDTMFTAIPHLKMDWSRFVDEEGHQLQTVGHHFSGSRPLNLSEMVKLDRRGVCISCHQTVPEGDVAIDLLSHVGRYSGLEIDKKVHESILNKSIRISAWVQLLLIPIFLLIGYLSWKLWQKAKA
jgi:hypothetical protein